MPDPDFDNVVHLHDRTRSGDADWHQVLVVGVSRINRVVVGKIAERVGLKVIEAAPDDAGDLLAAHRPATVVLDGGADDGDCAGVMDALARQREASGGRLPIVILLSNSYAPRADAGGTIDAVVVKPVLPDRLQPLLASLLDARRT